MPLIRRERERLGDARVHVGEACDENRLGNLGIGPSSSSRVADARRHSQLVGSATFVDGWLECSSGNYGRVNNLTKLTQWSLAASAIFDDTTPMNRAVMSYGHAGSGNNGFRASVVRRGTPFLFGMWNSLDLWSMYTAVTPQAAREYRFHHVYNGTTDRKLYVDANSVTDTGVAQRPDGNGDGLYLGRADESTSEPLVGRLNYVYLRDGTLSDVWIAAEDRSWRERDFYTLTID